MWVTSMLFVFVTIICAIFLTVNADRVDELKMVPRDDWYAKLPRKPLKWLRPIPSVVIISHTDTESCFSTADCIEWMQINQHYCMIDGCGDLPHNFYIGGDGAVYTGYGWRAVGEHAGSYNNKSIGISFIGSFHTQAPPKIQLEAAQTLLQIGFDHEGMTKNYTLVGQRQIQLENQSPGDELFKIIQTWPHWTNMWDSISIPANDTCEYFDTYSYTSTTENSNNDFAPTTENFDGYSTYSTIENST